MGRFKILFGIIFIALMFSNFQTANASKLIDTFNRSKDVTAYGTGHLDLSLSQKTPGQIAAQVIKILLAFLGVIFLILMMYGGFKWMLSGGNNEDISAAKKIIKNGFIGLLVILAAYGITSMIGSLLSQATSP